MRLQNRTLRNLTGAMLASFVTGGLFTLVGYSGGASVKDFVRELLIGISSFGAAFLFVSYVTKRDRILIDVVLLGLFGSIMGFVLKMIFLEGANGVPVYFRRVLNERSWDPIFDLVSHGILYIILLDFISTPCIIFGISLWLLVAKTTKQPSVGLGQ